MQGGAAQLLIVGPGATRAWRRRMGGGSRGCISDKKKEAPGTIARAVVVRGEAAWWSTGRRAAHERKEGVEMRINHSATSVGTRDLR